MAGLTARLDDAVAASPMLWLHPVRAFPAAIALLAATSAPLTVAAGVIRVGPGQPVRSVAEAARIAKDGDVVEIEAGDYVSDVAVWTQRALTIRGVGGRARLIANGASAEGKAIWVIRKGSVTVENVAFMGTRVPDRNGAGIRLESGRLVVRDCLFEDNENGMLVGNDPSIELEIHGSEFARNGAGDGQSHGVYAGSIRRLVVRGSYFHHGNVGHLLKSGARESFILYNRLTDETGGRASYELEFYAGGIAVVVGNLIEQAATTQNSVMVSFGASGYRWPKNELHVAHNTLVNDRPNGGVFIRAHAGAATARVVNNLLVGKGSLELQTAHESRDNVEAQWSEFGLPQRLDYRLKAGSRLVGRAKDPGAANGFPLRPDAEYAHPARAIDLTAATPLSPGAFQSPVR